MCVVGKMAKDVGTAIRKSLVVLFLLHYRAIRENIARVQGCIFTSLKDA